MADNDPMTLDEAANRFGLKVSTLRSEAKKGRLTIYKIGRKYYTSPNDIRRMVRACRVDPKAHTSLVPDSLTRNTSEAFSAIAVAVDRRVNGRALEPICPACNAQLKLASSASHPDFGSNYELRSFVCASCAHEEVITFDKAGQPYA